MSLQLAAQHMASRGRGPDTQLVHMAPQEVAGLQALAKARGGALTVNPDTGLAEAGFLKNILPMVIGAGITAATGGAAAPWMVGLGVGGAQALATGSLQKGLMAGLGAYGGAGLAGGLMGAGAAGTGLTATGGVMGANPMVAQPMTFGADALGSAAGQGVQVGAPILDAANMSQTGPNLFGPAGGPPPAAPAVGPTAQAFTGGAPQVQTATPMADRFSQLGQGVQNLGTEAGREAFMGKEGVGGGMGLMKYGLAGLAPMLFQDPKPMAERPKDTPRDYDFSYNRVADPEAEYTGAYTGQRTYFNPTFTERKAAGGGLMDIGPIQSMSDRNQAETMMANGGMRFAEGGETKVVQPVEQDPYYTMTGQSGDAFKYLMGQMPAPSRAAAPAAIAPATSGALGAVQSTAGAGSANATMRPYTFDPVTGAFTAMPVIAPAAAGGAGTGFYYDGGGGYGGDSGVGVGVGASDGSGPGAGAGTGGASAGDSGDGGVGAASAGDGWARGGIAALAMARGGASHLGDYSDGGRLLKGPGDGVSDSIPATIANKRPARLADGEFVVPARIVSELGNGSTEAGARKLYAMMDRIQKARGKTTGKNRVAVNSRAEKMLPA